jgi:hypothetical protein
MTALNRAPSANIATLMNSFMIHSFEAPDGRFLRRCPQNGTIEGGLASLNQIP